MKISGLPVMICLLLFMVSCSAGQNIYNEPLQLQTDKVLYGSDFFQSGMASWYGDDFHGKTTANGEIYDMHKLTAAHQTLPFHTIVEVENLENGEKVLVRINDRGPFLKNRIIDLSLQAARKLAMIGNGTAEVNIRLVHWPGAAMTTGSANVNNVAVEYFIQAGAFAVRENADDLILTLAEVFPDLQFKIIAEDELFKVLSGKFSDISRCQEIITKMATYQLQGFIRKTDIIGDY